MLTNLTKLCSIEMNNNKINCPLPTFIQCSNLYYLDISTNYFYSKSSVHSFDQLSELTNLIVHTNIIEGPLPTLIGTTNIVLLDIRNNLFSGSIPSSWQYLQSLDTLLGDHNMLETPINVLGILNNLISISLSHNYLTSFVNDPTFDGHVDYIILSAIGSSLQIIDLSSNFLSGTWLPGSDLKTLISINLQFNFVESFPMDLSYTGPVLQILDISFNNLQGQLPGIEDGFEPARIFSSLDVRGNPNFKSHDGTLPDCVMNIQKH
jgi:hypothetical protein